MLERFPIVGIHKLSLKFYTTALAIYILYDDIIIIYLIAQDQNTALFVQETYGNRYIIKKSSKSVNLRETCDLD